MIQKEDTVLKAESPLVSILFVTWNRREYLLRAIRSLLQQDYPNVEIVVVDNASTDNTVETILALFPNVRVLYMHRNTGAASARNVGVANCLGKYVYLMDDDGWFEDISAISKCVSVAEQFPNLSAVCSRIHNVDDDTWYPSLLENCLVSQFHATCVLLRKDIFLSTGGFPDDYFYIGEEEYVSLLFADLGCNIAVVADSVLKHENRKTAGKPLSTYSYYSIRNSNRTSLRLYPFPYSLLRVSNNVWHTLRFTITRCQPALPWRILCSLMADIFAPAFPRRPVALTTYRQYARLGKKPISLPEKELSELEVITT